MQFKELTIPGVILITPDIYEDGRGFFIESYNKEVFAQNGINIDFVQDNQSFSHRNVLRGLHYQLPPFAQDKLVSVIQGSVLDVVVDIRKNSKTFGQHVMVELDNKTKQMLLVPQGCAHGFLTLSDDVYFQYKVSDQYSPKHDRGIIWNDPDLAIDWGVANPLVSEKDSKLPSWQEIKEDAGF